MFAQLEDFENLELNEINDIITKSKISASIKKNVSDNYGEFSYDYLFLENFVDDVYNSAYFYIKHQKLIDCLKQFKAIKDTQDYEVLQKMYKFNFPNVDIDDTTKEIYEDLKCLHIPLVMYTYNSNILYNMNNILMKMYDCEVSDNYFENDYVKLSFIIVFCLSMIKKHLSVNNSCEEMINTTMSYLPYKSLSTYVYRGILINKEKISIEKLTHQVKINSFSKKPDGAKIVLEFYSKKMQYDQIYDNNMIVLYIAKNDKNDFIPVQFFNPQLKVSKDEEEVVTLPFVKYDCELVLDYDCETKNKTINNDNINIDLDHLHTFFFKTIDDVELHCRIYHIKQVINEFFI